MAQDIDNSRHNSQSIKIGNVGANGSVNLNQIYNEAPDTKYATQLEVIESSKKQFPKSYLKRTGITGILKLTGMVIIGLLGIVADVLGISQSLGFPFLVLLPIGLVGGLFVSIGELRYLYILVKARRYRGKAVFVGKNEIAEESPDLSQILVYQRSSKCIYHKCNGQIVLEHTPPRELGRIGRQYVGICSICGKDHSYRIDHNWVATPTDLDWRLNTK